MIATLMLVSLLSVTIAGQAEICTGPSPGQTLTWINATGASVSVVRVFPYLGVDLGSTVDAQMTVSRISDGLILAIVPFDRLYNSGGPSLPPVDWFASPVSIAPGDGVKVWWYCSAYLGNPYFGFSAANTHGQGWAIIWVQ